MFSLVQFSHCHVQLFLTPWTAACQASLSTTNSWSLLKLMSTKSVMPSNYLILCWPLLLPPSIFPSIRVFSSESVLRIRWPKYWSFSFSDSPFNEFSRLISFRIDCFFFLFFFFFFKDWLVLSPWSPRDSSPTPQFKSFNSSVLRSIHDYWKNHRLWLDKPLLAK